MEARVDALEKATEDLKSMAFTMRADLTDATTKFDQEKINFMDAVSLKQAEAENKLTFVVQEAQQKVHGT